MRRAAVVGVVAVALLAVGGMLWQQTAPPSHPPAAEEPTPPTSAPRPARPPPPPSLPAPTDPGAPPPEAPTADELADMLPGLEAHELPEADTGVVVDAAKMRAAQLHLIPPPDVPLRPLDEAVIDETLAELTPEMRRCLDGPGSGDGPPEVQLLLGPILDGTKSLLQVTELPRGHTDATTLACLTEVIRSAPFEPGPPTTYTVPLGI